MCLSSCSLCFFHRFFFPTWCRTIFVFLFLTPSFRSLSLSHTLCYALPCCWLYWGSCIELPLVQFLPSNSRYFASLKNLIRSVDWVWASTQIASGKMFDFTQTDRQTACLRMVSLQFMQFVVVSFDDEIVQPQMELQQDQQKGNQKWNYIRLATFVKYGAVGEEGCKKWQIKNELPDYLQLSDVIRCVESARINKVMRTLDARWVCKEVKNNVDCNSQIR